MNEGQDKLAGEWLAETLRHSGPLFANANCHEAVLGMSTPILMLERRHIIEAYLRGMQDAKFSQTETPIRLAVLYYNIKFNKCEPMEVELS